MRKPKQNLFERAFNSTFRCISKLLLAIGLIVISFILIAGLEIKIDYSMARTKQAVEKQVDFWGKLSGGFKFIKDLTKAF
jgi:hypothetical protein